MKLSDGVIHNKSRQEYLNRAKGEVIESAEELAGDKLTEKAAGERPVEKLVGDKVTTKDTVPSDKVTTETPKDKVDIGDKVKNVSKNVLKHVAKEEALDLASGGIAKVGKLVTGVLSGKSKGKPVVDKVKEIAEVAKASPEVEAKLEKGPKLFFMSGFDWWGASESSEGGLAEMVEHLPEAKLYEWDDESSILEEIKKMDKESPVVLVGHSFGGDSVVAIANELNSMKYGFREVDLLVTLDSVGYDNDIIPANVKKNLNFIGDRALLFNDGPNIARSVDNTDVVNEMRREDHNGIDNAKEVQKKILGGIDEVLIEYDLFAKSS